MTAVTGENHNTPVLPDPLPGAVGMSHITPYDWEAPDGLCGGSPHIHLVCTEAYVVTAGQGAVQTLTSRGYEESALTPGSVAWFTPGTVHRMVQRADLRVTVLMQNSGLPEAGDAVFTFPPHILADPETYAAAATLPDGPEREQAARRRRDLAVEGYAELRAALLRNDPGPLHDFYRAATRIVAPKTAGWEPLWRAGALAAAERTGEQIAAVAQGDHTHLADARARTATPSRYDGYGLCGRREEYGIPGTTLPHHVA